MNIGRALKYYRKMRNLTQFELASKSGVDDKYYGRIERNESSPTIKILDMVCTELDVKTSNLIRLAERF